MANLTIKKDVSYLNKDFAEFRESLIGFAQSYFSDTFNDFDPADPAMMFIEMSSYVGDVLSYYVDSQLKEMLLLHAEERKNVVQLAQSLGYKPRPTVPAKVLVDVYQIIPSTGTGINTKPDWDHALYVDTGMQISSEQNSDIIFRTLDDVNFAFSSSIDSTDVSIYTTDGSGEIEYYLLKKHVQAESGTQKEVTFNFSSPEKYSKVLLTDSNIISIDSVTDSDGNSWYEVPYLAQDTIFKSVSNVAENDPTLEFYRSQTPFLLKLLKVPKRFITRYRSDNQLELQFGAGVVNDNDEEITPNPDNVGLQTPTGVSKLNYAWNITNFMYSDTYGQAPSNTTLTVTYTVGGGIGSNAVVNSLSNINEVEFSSYVSNLDSTVVDAVRNSLAVNNAEAATGGRDFEDVEEIRNNALAYFAAQDRAVTKDDYITRVYSMPAKFGSISKAYIVQDDQLNMGNEKIANQHAMNLYILTYDANKKLITANTAIKQNLINYIDRYRMVTDSINIKDAYVINIGVKFEITVLAGYNSKEIVVKCVNELRNHFNIDNWQINEPIIKADLIRTIANVKGVQSVLKVDIENKFDSTAGYNPNVYDIPTATKNEIIYPSLDPAIFEVKYLDADIQGRVVSW